MNSKPDKEDRRCEDIAFLSEIIDNFIFWHPLKGPCQEKTLHHRKKVQFFFSGTQSKDGTAPFRSLHPGFSIVIGTDPKLICYQAPIRVKAEERKK